MQTSPDTPYGEQPRAPVAVTWDGGVRVAVWLVEVVAVAVAGTFVLALFVVHGWDRAWELMLANFGLVAPAVILMAALHFTGWVTDYADRQGAAVTITASPDGLEVRSRRLGRAPRLWSWCWDQVTEAAVVRPLWWAPPMLRLRADGLTGMRLVPFDDDPDQFEQALAALRR